jgi:hypothetical protein
VALFRIGANWVVGDGPQTGGSRPIEDILMVDVPAAKQPFGCGRAWRHLLCKSLATVCRVIPLLGVLGKLRALGEDAVLAANAIDFYQKAFGATEVFRILQPMSPGWERFFTALLVMTYSLVGKPRHPRVSIAIAAAPVRDPRAQQVRVDAVRQCQRRERYPRLLTTLHQFALRRTS